jgi:tRNA (guanine-N7-)-methyltransferase
MSSPFFRLRSFVCRDGRMTPAQRQAWRQQWDQYGLSLAAGRIDYQLVFGRIAPCLLEIGFGSGQSLLAAAKQYADQDFIGVEMYRPGIGAVMRGMTQQGLTNIRLYHADAIDVLEQCIPLASLYSVHIFFPDPWPKRRHHARRLIQPAFIQLVTDRLQAQGTLHLATDWNDYAQHIRHVLSQQPALLCLSDREGTLRSPYRPIISKFEQRSQRAGRMIWEGQFIKQG